MVEAGSRWSFNSEARLGPQVSNVVDEVAPAQIFRRALRFSPVSIIPPVLHLHLLVALTRRTNGEVWEPYEKATLFRKSGSFR